MTSTGNKVPSTSKRKRHESHEAVKFFDLMAHGRSMRATSVLELHGRAYYLNQALDAFQQALVYSAFVSTLQVQACLEQIRETQVDLLILAKLLHRQQLQLAQTTVRVPLARDPTARRAVKVLVPALPKPRLAEEDTPRPTKKRLAAKLSPSLNRPSPETLMADTLLTVAEALVAFSQPHN
ncbi:hypothetical protein ACHHYP_08534 [Achlya hypogyna]|uniref:Uncharacterized protein n=1 Tax=Achlya hypogyna TaxID=1202772 RepID=A0A1V9YPD6_ACHHY|nr:hypothetical protein ACHHYP_08534 [Achlya hypogyna]